MAAGPLAVAGACLCWAVDNNLTQKVSGGDPVQVVGADPDVLAWDAGWWRLYVASESGVVSIFRVDGSTLQPLGEVRAPHAHRRGRSAPTSTRHS